MPDINQSDEDQKEIGHAYTWLEKHGQESIEDLKELAQGGSPEGLERLHQLADDNSIPYDDSTDPEQLAEEIFQAMETNGNAGVE